MTAWMIWATIVTAVLGGAGLAVEQLLRVHGRPTRWAWVAALGAIIGLHTWSWIRPARSVGSTLSDEVTGLTALMTEGPQSTMTAVASFLTRADGLVVVAWLAGTVVLAASLGAGLWRLRRRMRRWPRARVGGEHVWLSDGFGPAVVGYWSPRIVMPRWILALSPEQFRLAFLHEWEHRAARDTLLLLGGAVAVVLAPWNAALWWVVWRLRQAVELDCDRRVVLAGVSRAAYGELLIDLSGVPLVSRLPVAALTKPASLLERRLKMITTDVTPGGPMRSASLSALVALLGIVACGAPAPSAIHDDGDGDGAQVVSAESSLQGQLEAGLEDRAVSTTGEPLVVVDGVLLEGLASDELDGLDPESIERIEVLKGEAAKSLYGPRGADGVIQIFTRDVPRGAEDVALSSPDRALTVRIRGTSGVEGDPKIYVDGVCLENCG